MFARFHLPSVPVVYRRTTTAAAVLGLAAFVILSATGRVLIGLGACIGLGLGMVNVRLIGSSVVKVAASADERKRRPLAMNTVARLSVISVVAVGLLLISFDLGLGTLVGLAVFEFVMLANVLRSMLATGGEGMGDDGVPGSAADLLGAGHGADAAGAEAPDTSEVI